MLQPKKTKHRKTFRVKHDKRAAFRGKEVSFEEFGLQATTSQ
ncbi:50S ribosomal protein L16 [Chlamydia trachomatis]|jgi:large subunit ribosomal protein L16|nr:50S ribosomal protein L16 [Chlamydia trachomatis]